MEKKPSSNEDAGRTELQKKRSLLELIDTIEHSPIFGLVVCLFFVVTITPILWQIIQWHAEVGHYSWTDVALLIMFGVTDVVGVIGVVVAARMILHQPQQDGTAEKEIRRVLIYAPEDVAFAQRLHRDLQERGYASVLGEESLMLQAVQKHPLVFIHDDEYHQVLLVLSPQSRADAWMSQLVKTTLRLEGLKSRTVLFLLEVEPISAPAEGVWSSPRFRKHVVQDFTHWQDEQEYQHALEQLITDLEVATRMVD